MCSRGNELCSSCTVRRYQGKWIIEVQVIKRTKHVSQDLVEKNLLIKYMIMCRNVNSFQVSKLHRIDPTFRALLQKIMEKGSKYSLLDLSILFPWTELNLKNHRLIRSKFYFRRMFSKGLQSYIILTRREEGNELKYGAIIDYISIDSGAAQ